MTALQELSDLAPAEFKQVQNAFKTQLATNPQAIETTLQGFKKDPKGLRLLLSQEDEHAVRTYSKMAKELQSGPVQKAFEADLQQGRIARNLVENGSEKQLQAIVTQTGGLDADVAVSMRAGVFQELLNTSKTRSEVGAETIDSAAFLRKAQTLKDSGKLNALFRPKDWRQLDNLIRYASVTKRSMDTGGSIQVGEVSGALSRPLHVNRFLSALHAAGSSGFMARLLTRPASLPSLQSEFETFPIRQFVTSGSLVLEDIREKKGSKRSEMRRRLTELTPH
jgi:hypothetical protein